VPLCAGGTGRLRCGLVLGTMLVGLPCAAVAAIAGRSASVRPSASCTTVLSLAAPPLVVFPSSNPQTRSGPGALLWSGPRGCGPQQALGSLLGPDDLPGPNRPLVGGAGDLVGLAAATGTGTGQVMVVGSGLGGSGVLAEGRVAGAFAGRQSLGGPPTPVAAVSGYLGDAAIVSTVPSRTTAAPMHRATSRPQRGTRGTLTEHTPWELAVRIQRHYSNAPNPPRLLPVGPERPSAVAVALDYRSDVLVAWATRAGVYAREIVQTGRVEPVHRLGSGTGASELQALISDDGHAIVAWRSQATAGGMAPSTSIEASISGPSLNFGQPTVVERFRDLHGLTLPPGSLRLTRLSSEAVMMAWTGLSAGRYVVRASPVSLWRGVWAPVTISTPAATPTTGTVVPGSADDATKPSTAGTEALLAELTPGPRAEVLALWTVAPRQRDGALNPDRRRIVVAAGHYAGHGEAAFAAPETIAPAGPNGTPTAAFDPGSDQALVAWARVTGRSARIAYVLRTAGHR
jgi:hypothetical protein